MERTLISFNVPNLITVPLMAFLGFAFLALVWNVVGGFAGKRQPAQGAGGF